MRREFMANISDQCQIFGNCFGRTGSARNGGGHAFAASSQTCKCRVPRTTAAAQRQLSPYGLSPPGMAARSKLMAKCAKSIEERWHAVGLVVMAAKSGMLAREWQRISAFQLSPRSIVVDPGRGRRRAGSERLS